MIIGITGTLGAGKGTVVEYLVREKGFVHVAVSDTFLAGEAAKRGLEATRPVRRDIANEYRAKGPTALMEAVYEMGKTALAEGRDIVLEPQHTAAEVKFIQSVGGTVLAIDADLRTRYDRITQRGSTKDNVTFNEFATEQEREMRSDNPDENNLGAAIAAADFTLRNDGTPEELYAQVEATLAEIRLENDAETH